MEQIIDDVHILPENVEFGYSPVIDMFTEVKTAIIRAGGSNVGSEK